MAKRNPLDLGARIVRFVRERSSLSQGQLAELSGVSQSLISKPAVTAARRRWAKPARRDGEAPYAFPQYRRDPPGS